MPRFINYGSINIDEVYGVAHFVQPGETLAAHSFAQLLGGKGANQSIALAHCGIAVEHWGKFAKHDQWILQNMQALGVDTQFLQPLANTPSGKAIIQVTPQGENAILLLGGANQAWQLEEVLQPIQTLQAGDWFLCQNETPFALEALAAAKAQGATTCWNPAPAPQNLPQDHQAWWKNLDYLILNQSEAQQLFASNQPEVIQQKLHNSSTQVIYTLGAAGGYYIHPDKILPYPAELAKVVDTTAAGDTFIGFFLGSMFKGIPLVDALSLAAKAAALCVSRPGAAPSIPYLAEINASK